MGFMVLILIENQNKGLSLSFVCLSVIVFTLYIFDIFHSFVTFQ